MWRRGDRGRQLRGDAEDSDRPPEQVHLILRYEREQHHMPSYRKAFPSKFLKADDLPTPQEVEIKHVGFEDVGTGQNQERKLVAHFVEFLKGSC